jgi:hypothetical protein
MQETLFFHEYVEKIKRGHQEDLDFLYKHEVQYGIYFDIAEAWNLWDDTAGTNVFPDDLFLYSAHDEYRSHIIQIDSFLDYIEAKVLPGQWVLSTKLSEEKTNRQKIPSEYLYYYRHPQHSQLILRFQKGYCKRVKTGKMIEEEIWSCH